jgi:hypothetical protein
MEAPKFDIVNRAEHYNTHPSGIEVIDIIRHMSFDLGCVLKYAMRRKGKEGQRSLSSAVYYINDHWANRVEESGAAYQAIPLLQQYVFAEPVEEARQVYHAVIEYMNSPSAKSAAVVVTALESLKASGK